MAWTRKGSFSRWVGCFVRHGGIFVGVSPNRLQKVTNYFRENETEAEQDYKDSEQKENIDSTTGVSEEIPAVKQELNEDSTQIIQRHWQGQGNAQKTYRLSKEANKNLRQMASFSTN